MDDELWAEVKAVAARTGRTLTQVIEDALRESLAAAESKRSHAGLVELPAFDGNGLRPGVALDTSAGLRELMDRNSL